MNGSVGTLYLVNTPIGNLGDMTGRALDTLRAVDLVAAEDTRRSLQLLNYFGISKPLTSYYEHNKAEKGGRLIERLRAGESVALVSDAGSPAISDPGEDLVRDCIEAGVPVVPVPGPTAFVTALIASGLPTGRFSFEGFLPVPKRKRAERLSELRACRHTMIFYEAPHKLRATLADFRDTFGPERRIVLARELTKKHEEFIRTTVDGAIRRYGETEPRGEFVLVVDGAPETAAETAVATEPIEVAYNALVSSGMDGKEAMKAVAKERGISKREVYAYLVEKKKQI